MKVPGRRDEGTAFPVKSYRRKIFCPWAQDFLPLGTSSCAQGRKTFKKRLLLDFFYTFPDACLGKIV